MLGQDTTTPSKRDLLKNALAQQADLDFFVLRDNALLYWPGFDDAYIEICDDYLDGVPDRIHNCKPAPHNKWGYTPDGDDNQWGYHSGPEYCWPENLGALPPDLSQEQIKQINAGVPVSQVIVIPATPGSV